jgi:transcriptional regulator with XRE-family HTH domain
VQVLQSGIDFNQKLATLLKELRGSRSYRDFAEMIGSTHTDVRRWESGKGEPRLRVLGKIAALRGWTLDELMVYLEGEALPKGPRIPQLLAEVRSLPFEDAVQVAKVALETIASKGESSDGIQLIS